MRTLVLSLLLVSTLAKASAPKPVPPPQTWAEFMGIVSFDPTARAALRVEAIRTASFAHVIGLEPGDVIVALNDFPVASAEAFQKVARWFAESQPTRWRFTVAREGVAEPFLVTAAPGHACDPLKLIGCGPLPKKAR